MNGVSVSCVLSLNTEVFRSKTGYIIIVDNNIIAGGHNFRNAVGS